MKKSRGRKSGSRRQTACEDQLELSGFADVQTPASEGVRSTSSRIESPMNSAEDPDLAALLRNSSVLTGAHFFIVDDLVHRLIPSMHPLMGDTSLLRDLLLLLLLSLEEGSLCLREGEIKGLLFRNVDADLEGLSSVMGAVQRCEAALRTPEDFPWFTEQSLLVVDAGSLYFSRHFLAVQSLRHAIQTSVEQDDQYALSSQREKEILRDILELRPVRVGGHPLTFTQEQTTSLSLGLKHSIFVLSGGPGTGKTTIILSLLRALVRAGVQEIRLAAPTGKAAARMNESVRMGLQSIENPSEEDLRLEHLQPVTLHRLLGIRPGRDEPEFGPESSLPADLVIVDEVSMVDILMMDRLLRALDLSRTRLILIGDRDQLPSVDAGAVLADLIRLLEETGPDRFVLLTHGHRSESAVRAAASWINGGGQGPDPFRRAAWKNLTERWKLDATLLLQKGPSEEIADLMRLWMDLAFPERYTELVKQLSRQDAPRGRRVENLVCVKILDELFLLLSRSRILTILRKGPTGAEGLNRFAQLHLADRIGASLRSKVFSGLPVLIRRNDSLRGLSNGDTGLVIEFRGRMALALFPHEGGYAAFTPDVLPVWEPAFAMTVHKSQGSEYDRVLLVLPDAEEHPLMTRQILYTAVTRARKLVAVYGEGSALAKAAQRELVRLT